jgi:hypothetical protein
MLNLIKWRLPSQHFSHQLRLTHGFLYPIAPQQKRLGERLHLAQQLTGALVFGLIGFGCCFGTSFGFGSLLGEVFSVGVMLILLFALVGLPSAFRAARLSGLIAAERQRGTYDLVSLSNLGAFGLHCWIATSHASTPSHERPAWFRYGPLAPLLQVLSILAILVLLYFVGRAFLVAFERAPLDTVIVNAYVISSIFCFKLYFDQNRTAATLIGSLIPARIEKAFEAQFWAFVLFAVFQLVTIVLTILAGFVLPSILFPLEIQSLDGFDLVLILYRVALFVGLREMLIIWLWGHLRWRLNGYDEELDRVSRIAL